MIFFRLSYEITSWGGEYFNDVILVSSVLFQK